MGRFIDETGNRFGRYVVIGRVENRGTNAAWLCQCDCGTEREVMGTTLRSGHTQSCGCWQRERASLVRFVDLTGKQYGYLTVVRRIGSLRGQSLWLCQCRCGKETTVPAAPLKNGNTRSCGCYRTIVNTMARVLPDNDRATFNALFRRMKNNAQHRKYNWRLSYDQAYTLTQQSCRYCGTDPKQLFNHPIYNKLCLYNGIDRVDNTKGYIIDNVVPCCKICNFAKNSLSVEQFRDWICAIYNHFIVMETSQ